MPVVTVTGFVIRVFRLGATPIVSVDRLCGF